MNDNRSDFVIPILCILLLAAAAFVYLVFLGSNPGGLNLSIPIPSVQLPAVPVSVTQPIHDAAGNAGLVVVIIVVSMICVTFLVELFRPLVKRLVGHSSQQDGPKAS